MWGFHRSVRKSLRVRRAFVLFSVTAFVIAVPASAHAAPTFTGPVNYVALGDSFSSGEGAFSYQAGTDVAGVNQCHRSTVGWPPLVLSQLPAGSTFGPTGFRACSGAILLDVLSTFAIGGQGQWNEGSQIVSVNANADLVSMSIGGNDLGFGAIARACIVTHTPVTNADEDVCEQGIEAISKTGIKLLKYGGWFVVSVSPNGTVSGPFPCVHNSCRQASARTLGDGTVIYNTEVPSLAKVYEQIHAQAPNAQVRAMLYPRLFANVTPLATSCLLFDSFIKGVAAVNGREIHMLVNIQKKLNSIIKNAAYDADPKKKWLQTVNPDPDFDNRRLCNANGGTTTVNSLFNEVLVGATNFTGPEVESLHPNAAGQRALANALLRNLGMPLLP